MRALFCYCFVLIFFCLSTYQGEGVLYATNLTSPYEEIDLIVQDTLDPRYGDFINDGSSNPFDLNDPGAINQNVEYDPVTGNYIITEQIGNDYFRSPTYMTFSEYLDWRAEQQERAYFQQLAGISSTGQTSESGIIDPIAKFDVTSNLLDRLFGGTTVDIRPEGKIDLTFGIQSENVENPIIPERNRKKSNFDFDMNIQANVTGSIGEKLQLGFNYNTGATFDFDNQMKLAYDGAKFSEDDIIKSIEAGNVSLPLNNSLIHGSESLFGIKTELQFGRLFVTALASQQKSKRDEIKIQGGSQIQEFEVPIDQYDENRHFFLSHFNRNNFEDALKNLPQIRSLFRVEEIEVWVTNTRNATTQIRDIVAVADLGTADPVKMTNQNPSLQPSGMSPLPDNDANPIYSLILSSPNDASRKLETAVSEMEGGMFQMEQVRDFEKVQARKLDPSEFTFHKELGFLSINVSLSPSDVLGVAYKYKYNDGEDTYQVGEMSYQIPNDSITPNVVYVKMLKSSTSRIDLPMWDLMMKNVYSTGAYQANQRDFKLDIFYDDPGRGDKRFIPNENSNLFGVPLLTLFNLDQLNAQGDPRPDGVFDYVPGVTIIPRTGKLIFPILEPFGDYLQSQLDPPFDTLYSFPQLYDSTLFRAREFPEKNRFVIKGEYKSEISSEISLGAFNIPINSETVYAGGRRLEKDVDYTIDYNIGRVKILNDAILNSGTPVRVTFEDNTLFGFQTKTLWGTRLEYRITDDFRIGGTFLNLFERPFTQKVNIGDDPINNKVYGLDVNLSKPAPWLTKFVDAIPFIDTKEESNITVLLEGAYLDPGHAKAINQEADKSGATYLDDFEGSTSSFDLKTPSTSWVLASVPQNDENDNNPNFPESDLTNDLRSGSNRALINWYRIESNIRNSADQNNPYTRDVSQLEIFPNLNLGSNTFAYQIPPFDISYYPSLRGPYNFDIPGGHDGYSAGVKTNVDSAVILNEPATRWGGVMRSLTTTDFEAANIEYIEFWMLNPFIDKPTHNGRENVYQPWKHIRRYTERFKKVF